MRNSLCYHFWLGVYISPIVFFVNTVDLSQLWCIQMWLRIETQCWVINGWSDESWTNITLVVYTSHNGIYLTEFEQTVTGMSLRSDSIQSFNSIVLKGCSFFQFNFSNMWDQWSTYMFNCFRNSFVLAECFASLSCWTRDLLLKHLIEGNIFSFNILMQSSVFMIHHNTSKLVRYS